MKNITDNLVNSATQKTDTRDLNAIKAAANRDARSPAVMKAAAEQFEALLLSMILKSMRESIPEDGIFNTQQSKIFNQLLDQEVSQQVSKRGLGLADQMLRQMVQSGQLDAEATAPYLKRREVSSPVEAYRAMLPGASAKEQSSALLQQHAPAFRPEGKAAEVTPAGQTASSRVPGVARKARSVVPDHVKAFTGELRHHAEAASRTTGIAPEFMMAQAALESGWGKKQIRHADGSPSHNLFGIKATGWHGKTVNVMTTEYENGRRVRKVEKFRAYDSYEDAFKDYARLLNGNPRYRRVVNAQDPAVFAYGLQRAGYATDPQYGAKLMSVINRVRQA